MNKMHGVVWITGLPGAGKTTLANLLVMSLKKFQITPILLDGDTLRAVFNNQQYDRSSRLNLATTYSKLATELAEQDHLVVVATVSMFDEVRELNRKSNARYCEVYLEVPMDELYRRDQKALYSKALNNSVENVPSVNMSLELPKEPDIIFTSSDLSALNDNVDQIMQFISSWT